MKKAWERELELLEQSKPVILQEEEQGWLFSEQVESMEDIFTKMKWSSNVPGSGAPEHVIVGAIQAMENLGYDVSLAEELIPEGFAALERNDMQELHRLTAHIWHLFNQAPIVANHPHWSYTIYESFSQYAHDVNFPQPVQYRKEHPKYLEKTYYGWLAQICAGAAGTAVEGYVPSAIYEAFGLIQGYVRKPNTYNDDITYEVAFLKALENKGRHLTSSDISEQWVALVPFGWSAEEWALKNIKLGIYPPESGKLHNPYREWIGAQMRGAVCGMVAPGDLKLAAELAYKDGIVSHHNSGVIGEVFNAMLVSLAYVENDIKEIVETVVGLIPPKSEYYSVVSKALEIAKRHTRWEDAWEECRKDYIHYNWIHCFPNAAAEVIALWFGEGDFTKTISISCHQGYDVDCNAAQIATVLGIINIEHTLELQWTEPIGDRLDTYIRGFKNMKITELAAWTVACSKLL